MDFNTHFLPLIMPVFTYTMWLIPIMLAIGGFKLLLSSKFRGLEGERLVQNQLKKLGLETINDVILPDGKNGLTQIDHIVLMPDNLIVIETKNYNGILLGKKNDSKWTHKIGRKTHYLQNPLRQNYLHIRAVEALNLGVPVHGLVVFTNNSKFPKGLPEGVTQLKYLKQELEDQISFSAPSQQLKDAWLKLKQTVRTDKDAKKQHMDMIFQKHGKDKKKPAALIIISISIVWLLIMTGFTSLNKEDNTLIQSALLTISTKTDNYYKNKVTTQLKSQSKPGKIIGYREEWVPGRPIEQCVGADRELNTNVLRCRNGYKHQVPIFSN